MSRLIVDQSGCSLNNLVMTRLERNSNEYLYSYLRNNGLLYKYIYIIGVKPTSVKYYFVRIDTLSVGLQNSTITILEGFDCEKSDLTTKPDCMSEEEYSLIPDEYKGVEYSIYYERHPFIATITYQDELDTQLHYTSFQSERISQFYCYLTSLDDIENLFNFPAFSDVFVATSRICFSGK